MAAEVCNSSSAGLKMAVGGNVRYCGSRPYSMSEGWPAPEAPLRSRETREPDAATPCGFVHGGTDRLMRQPNASASVLSDHWRDGAGSCEVRRRIAFSAGFVEERQYLWSQPLEDVITISDDLLVLHMALTPRPAPMRLHRGLRFGDEDVGRILLLQPGETLRFSGPTGRLRSMLCALDVRRFREIAGAELGHMAVAAGDPEALGSGVGWLLNRVHHELRHDGFGRAIAVEGYVNALSIELARRMRRCGTGEAPMRKGGLSPWRMRRLRERLEVEAPAPSLPELAELCGMTVRQLSRAFKAETGMTVGRFVDEAIAERAQRLLLTTDRSIGEIATALGFATSASFACAFRRCTGALPSEVRRLRWA
jgi:AraC family transcriptional regulator